ncbi:hypothetical protein [uncultured Holdemanella sp.]|nr:hypothetical protein [uncultured Holdemanella sp.]
MDNKNIEKESALAAYLIEEAKKKGLTPFQTGMIRGTMKAFEGNKKGK